MKMKLLFITIVLLANGSYLAAQSVKFIPFKDTLLLNPASVSPVLFNNKPYFIGLNYSVTYNNASYELFECDNEIRIVPPPRNYNSVAYDFLKVYSNKLYVVYERPNDHDPSTQLPFEYDGNSFTPLSEKSFVPSDASIIYNQKLYCTYSGSLIRLDGNSFQPVEGIENIKTGFMLYKDKLVFGAGGYLYTYDGSKFTSFYCEPACADYPLIKAIVFKNNLYTSYMGVSNYGLKMGMARFDGATLQFIDNHSENEVNDGDFSLYGDNLYYSIRSLSNANADWCQLVQYNGTSKKLLSLPPDTKYSFPSSRLPMNNKLYTLVQNYSNPNRAITELAVLENDALKVITDTSGIINIESDIFLFDNKLYGSCLDKDRQNKLFEFDGARFRYFPLPAGDLSFSHPFIWKNTLYFMSGNRLAYFDNAF